MLTKSLVRATSALVGLTYLSSQGYLVYHLAYGKKISPLHKISSDAVPVTASKDRQHLIDSVVGLYQLRYTNDAMMYYDQHAVFEDPFVRLESRKALASGMSLMLSTFKQSDTKHLDVLHGQDSMVIELTQEYTLKGLGIKVQVPSVIHLKLTGPPGEEKIKEHIEEWGGKELLRSGRGNPMMNLSESVRRLHGKVSSAIFPLPEGYIE